jgi:hypothetical protein
MRNDRIDNGPFDEIVANMNAANIGNTIPASIPFRVNSLALRQKIMMKSPMAHTRAEIPPNR